MEAGVGEVTEPQADGYRCVGGVEKGAGAVLRWDLFDQ